MAGSITLRGRWRLTAVKREAAWDQRFVVSDSANADGTYQGTVGQTVEVAGKDDQPWTVTIQHNDGSGWADSQVRTTSRQINGSQIRFEIESEDSTDMDFEDLVVRAEKVRMVEVAVRPYALTTDTLQMMPDGIFETSLARYYMGVRIRNVWTEPLPAGSQLGISANGRAVLSAGGVDVLDTWGANEGEQLGQRIVGNRIDIDDLDPWESRTVYFKLDVSDAQPRKHPVEFEVAQPGAPDPNHSNRRADHHIFVSRSSFDSSSKEFTIECDQGALHASLGEVAVEHTTLHRAIECAKELREGDGSSAERVRELLEELLEGGDIDLCELHTLLACACRDGRRPDGRDGRDGEGKDGTVRGPCEDVLVIPTKVDYRVEPDPQYTGQYGPLPYEDPWWKVLLAIIAIVLSIAAGASMITDLAYRNDDVLIGQLFESKLETEPGEDLFLVDAALCDLNGNRDLPAAIPPVQLEDAQSGEDSTIPVSSLDGVIQLSGETMTNAEIANIVTTLAANPTDPDAQAQARVFKSGARSGTTHGIMKAVEPISRSDHDGVIRDFRDQVRLEPLDPPDPAADQPASQAGDSGSIWVHADSGKIVAHNHAGSSDDSGDVGHGSRIEDVTNKLNIRFQ